MVHDGEGLLGDQNPDENGRDDSSDLHTNSRTGCVRLDGKIPTWCVEKPVLKDWPVRLTNCVFTVPKGTSVQVIGYDAATYKYLINFGSDIDWIHESIVHEYLGDLQS